MELNEILNLISIRQYINQSINNCALDRPTINELNGMQILIDNKIISLLKSPEFKDYIGYANVREAIMDVAKITNIRSGLKK
jgi:hypothetical protein